MTSAPFQIFGDTSLVLQKKPICITFGNFDGVHLGHLALLDFMTQHSNNNPLVVVTFEPHSSNFFSPQKPKSLLTNLQDKINLLLKHGVKTVVVKKFDEEFAGLSADDFCEQWVHAHFSVSSVILGYDFCYGKNRKGNIQHMQKYQKKYGWQVWQVPPFVHIPLLNEIHERYSSTESEPVSSSRIRQEIALGHMENAEHLLGRPYAMGGVVTLGDQRGRTIGFPTANLKLDCPYALPHYGVYACDVELHNNGKMRLLPAAMNCGIRPSVGEGLTLQVEAHILNFNEDIYGEHITFHVKKFIRGEKKFAGLEELKKQIAEDIKTLLP